MTEPNDPRPSLADYHRWIDTAESQGFDSVKMPIDDLRALLAVAEAHAAAWTPCKRYDHRGETPPCGVCGNCKLNAATERFRP